MAQYRFKLLGHARQASYYMEVASEHEACLLGSDLLMERGFHTLEVLRARVLVIRVTKKIRSARPLGPAGNVSARAFTLH